MGSPGRLAPRQVCASSSAKPSGRVTPSPQTEPHCTDLGVGAAGGVCGCWIRKKGGTSHCGLRTKGFQRCPRTPPPPPPLRPAPRQTRRSRCIPGSRHAAPSPPAARRAARGPASPAAILPRRPSHNATPLARPPLPGPGIPLKMRPPAPQRSALLASFGSLSAAPTSIPEGSLSPAAAAAGLRARCRAPGGRGGRCPGCASAPGATASAPGTRVPRTRVPRNPSLPPSLFPRCSVSASRGRCILNGRREGGGKARPPAETPCDGHRSVTRSFG